MRDDLRDYHDQCLALARELGREGDELVEWWSERAAIREMDGGLPRADAEAEAFAELRTAFAEPRRGPLRAGAARPESIEKLGSDE